MFAMVLLVALAVVLAGIFPFRQIIAQERQVDLTQQKYDALVEENARLEAEAAALQTPQEVERIAREHYGLVRPGEIGYVAVSPQGAPPVGPEPEAPTPIEPEWWETVRDFFTGKDLVPGE